MRVRPYRLIVVAKGWRRGAIHRGRGANHRGAHTRIAPINYAIVGWTANQSGEGAICGRLPSSGSFCFNGGLRAIAAVRRYFRQSGVYQVSLRTDQDRTLLIYNRHADGRITFYDATEGN